MTRQEIREATVTLDNTPPDERSAKRQHHIAQLEKHDIPNHVKVRDAGETRFWHWMSQWRLLERAVNEPPLRHPGDDAAHRWYVMACAVAGTAELWLSAVFFYHRGLHWIWGIVASSVLIVVTHMLADAYYGVSTTQHPRETWNRIRPALAATSAVAFGAGALTIYARYVDQPFVSAEILLSAFTLSLLITTLCLVVITALCYFGIHLFGTSGGLVDGYEVSRDLLRDNELFLDELKSQK